MRHRFAGLSLGIVPSVVSSVSSPVILIDRLCQPRREENSGSFHGRASFITRAAGTSPPVFPSVDCASADVIHADFPREFQRNQELPVSGHVDSATIGALKLNERR